MKKMFCLAFALLLCLTSTAMAESRPSRTAHDMTMVEVDTAYPLAGSGFFIRLVEEDEIAYQTHLDACAIEVAKLAASQDVETYFGEITDYSGHPVSLRERLATDAPKVFEFWPVIAGGYDKSYGKVDAKLLFPTPYEKDEKVVVTIGRVRLDQEGNQTVEWTAYEGVGLGVQKGPVEKEGAILVKQLDPEIVLAIQNEIALLAVVSK